MLVKEIIRVGAELLDMKNVIEYIDSMSNNSEEVDSEIADEINTFMLAINMVNTGIASSYLELINTKILTPNNDGKITYKSLDSRGVIEVKKVESISGNEVDFKTTSEGILLDENASCYITYSHFPDILEIDDEIDYYLKVSTYIFALGVVGEYLYIKGNIDDAYMWDKRFKRAMFNLVRPRRNIVLPVKGW